MKDSRSRIGSSWFEIFSAITENPFGSDPLAYTGSSSLDKSLLHTEDPLDLLIKEGYLGSV
jgi:hypothetical protein